MFIKKFVAQNVHGEDDLKLEIKMLVLIAWCKDLKVVKLLTLPQKKSTKTFYLVPIMTFVDCHLMHMTEMTVHA